MVEQMEKMKNKAVEEKYKALIQSAREARERAYAPYSNYYVGAAILTESGDVFTGCNIENASYPATICAERVAITKAVSEGYSNFEAIVVATQNGGSPCGICRQVMNEFAPDMTVLVVSESEVVYESTVSELLPDGFGPANLLR